MPPIGRLCPGIQAGYEMGSLPQVGVESIEDIVSQSMDWGGEHCNCFVHGKCPVCHEPGHCEIVVLLLLVSHMMCFFSC